MSRSETTVDVNGYIDMEFSSGDYNKMKCKQLYQEENNNEIDELTKDFSEMGCIVDAMKRPPNICVETCVYEESDSGNDKSHSDNNENEDAAYSDEFEEDKSDIEIEVIQEEVKQQSKSANSVHISSSPQPIVKLSKSLSNSCNIKQPSLSGRSTNYGSVSVPPTRRINMSFTNERLREIERHNHILLNKILSARNNKKSSITMREQSIRKPVPAAAAVHRKRQQRQIDHDNMILLKKIQRVKSSACSLRR
ncbi:unnamed protein product [Parnassius mnemosyne]|uniref:Cilia- and flagella-associated protein 97-like n=1 Tax=Parnassius mnemosyne TaxID=213953 RepID=A0AAV1L136_9NEOP